jgi:hypothetical protein
VAPLLIGGIVIGLLVLVICRHPRVALVLLTVPTLALAYVEFRQSREEWWRPSRISAREIELADVRLAQQNGLYHLVGRVRNDSSRYTLDGLRLHVTVQDCAGQFCRAAMDRDEDLRLVVPPGQPRDFDLPLAELKTPLLGQYSPRCMVLRAHSA